MKHLGPKRIETERLILRRFNEEDAQAMYDNWASDDEVTKFLTWPTHANVEITKKVMQSWIEGNKYEWCIEPKADGEAMGSLCMSILDEDAGLVEAGYCLSRKRWGNGYAAEALKAAIEFMFTEAGARRIIAIHDAANPNSGRVMQKAGMVHLETRRAEPRGRLPEREVEVYVIGGDA